MTWNFQRGRFDGVARQVDTTDLTDLAGLSDDLVAASTSAAVAARDAAEEARDEAIEARDEAVAVNETPDTGWLRMTPLMNGESQHTKTFLRRRGDTVLLNLLWEGAVGELNLALPEGFWPVEAPFEGDAYSATLYPAFGEDGFYGAGIGLFRNGGDSVLVQYVEMLASGPASYPWIRGVFEWATDAPFPSEPYPGDPA